MIVRVKIFSKTHPSNQGGAPFFEKDLTKFRPPEKKEYLGERQLARILRTVKADGFFVPHGIIKLELTLPCEDLRLHINSDEKNRILLDMEAHIEFDEEVVKTLEEDGWTPINQALFFDTFSIIPANVH